MIKRHHNIDLLKQLFQIPNFDETNMDHWEKLHQLSIQSIVNANGALPVVPPFEKHPYLEKLDPQSTSTGLMIGTFPPITYLCSQYHLANLKYNNQTFTAPDLDYFHGNYSSLWKYAPINFWQIQLVNRDEQPQLIIDALNAADVLYTDIIKYTQRELNNDKYDAGDKKLNSILPNAQIFEFLKEAIVDRLYFTNASFFHTNNNLFTAQGLLRLNENDAFGLFVKTALDLNIKVEYSLWKQDNWIELNELPKPLYVRNAIHNDLNVKVFLKLRLTFGEEKKVYSICSAVSPAAVNRGAVRQNACVLVCKVHLKIPIADAPSKLLSETLSCFFNNNLIELAQYNA
ncbi:MAG: hypothetical protein Q8R57_01050 [Bacteroidota bacterium]|nr:hypothetical protein [Bacteroidota bacterium]